jgi:hypothetical protein
MQQRNELLKKLGLYTVEEYCALRGISPHTAANERCLKQGPRYIKRGRLILYPEDAITEFLESGTR